jgi:general stress protein 26
VGALLIYEKLIMEIFIYLYTTKEITVAHEVENNVHVALALSETDRPLGKENMNKLKAAEFNVHWFLL